MLEKSPLTHPFMRLAGVVGYNVIANKSSRSLCEALKVKKLVSQERISIKESDEAKEQFSKVINDLATVENEKFLNFNKFTDKLDTFYAKLPIVEYSAL